MGAQARRTTRMIEKHKPVILKKLYSLNRFSSYLDYDHETDDIQDQIGLQAVCISELGRVIHSTEDIPKDNVIKWFEFIFEKHGGKWIGEPSQYFVDKLDDERLNTFNIASILKRIDGSVYGIEKRKICNKWHYMTNGYKDIMRKDVLW